MKNVFTLIRHALAVSALVATGSLSAQAQSVGIGTTAPDASAALDVVASAKGALLPRMTTAGRLGIPSPATGLIVFQTDGTPGFYYNAGTPGAPSWQQLNPVGGAGDNLGNHTATQHLQLGSSLLTGNGGTNGLGVGADGQLRASTTNPGSGSANWIAANVGAGTGDRVVSGLLFGTATVGGHDNDLSAWAPLALNPGGGNVGIGTSAPAQKLDVTGGSIRISTAGQGLAFPDGSTQTTANRALSLVGQNLTLGGTGGNTVVLPTGSGGKTIAAVASLGGFIDRIHPSSAVYVFAGPTFPITISSSTQRLVGSGAAPLGLAAGATTIEAHVGMCYQSTVAGSPILNFMGGAFNVVDISTTRSNVPACGSVSNLAPGTYNVGFGVKNTDTTTAINNNDFVNGYVMVLN